MPERTRRAQLCNVKHEDRILFSLRRSDSHNSDTERRFTGYHPLYPLALSEDDGAQCLHFCQQLVQQLVLKEGGTSQKKTTWEHLHRSIRLILSTRLSLWPLAISLRLPRGDSGLGRVVLRLSGGGAGRGRGRVAGRAGPGVLRGQLGFAPEGVSVLGRRSRVAAAQRDQQGRSVLPGDPLVGQESRLGAGRVRVEVSLEQIRLGEGRRRQKRVAFI
ncbi:hypothetical protein EYF80_021827 [Liparis tanakae]|uniref:Uncharacterized protein n=1 Tax=Liparis tanakae TaxID=230148 RepID=A0A4Z2HPW9_9TELE|nr:hypothetical protein EYF80_021827 [Liparis tanakae]